MSSMTQFSTSNVVDDKNCAAMRESVDWETEYGGYDHVS
jgi:hypothetical protein